MDDSNQKELQALRATLAMLRQRSDLAVKMCIRFGGIDGNHHKAWVLDQMVRALTGCPENPETGGFDANDSYRALVREACGEGEQEGEDDEALDAMGADWDVGIPP